MDDGSGYLFKGCRYVLWFVGVLPVGPSRTVVRVGGPGMEVPVIGQIKLQILASESHHGVTWAPKGPSANTQSQYLARLETAPVSCVGSSRVTVVEKTGFCWDDSTHNALWSSSTSLACGWLSGSRGCGQQVTCSGFGPSCWASYFFKKQTKTIGTLTASHGRLRLVTGR